MFKLLFCVGVQYWDSFRWTVKGLSHTYRSMWRSLDGGNVESVGFLPSGLLEIGFFYSGPTLGALREHEGNLQPQVPLRELSLAGP